jgi:hypothetical protein
MENFPQTRIILKGQEKDNNGLILIKKLERAHLKTKIKIQTLMNNLGTFRKFTKRLKSNKFKTFYKKRKNEGEKNRNL